MEFWDLNPHTLRNDGSFRTRTMARRGMVGCVLDIISPYDWRVVRNWYDAYPGTILSRRVAESADGLASWSAYIWFLDLATKNAFVAFARTLPSRPFTVDLAQAEGADARKAALTTERAGQNVWLRERWDGSFVVEFADMKQALDFSVRWGGRISAEGTDGYRQPVPPAPTTAMPPHQVEQFLSFCMPAIATPTAGATA